jgi:hypothetical protein
MPPRLTVRRDPALAARLVRTEPLRYAAGADPSLDRPAHVRAASGLARFGGRIAVIQDDANFVVLLDPADGGADVVPLPAGEGGLRQFDDVRGNKRFKLDLEACVAVEADGAEMLLAFGSGSTPLRERIAVLRAAGGANPGVRVVDASALYAGLRAERDFSGSELNVEGAVALGGVLRLFNRGNGAPRDGLLPVNASCDLALPALLACLRDPAASPPPAPENVVQYDLGEIGGLPLTFTDAAALGDAILFSAAAEDSPDAVRDGPVAGSALGVLGPDGGRWAPVTREDGAAFDGKVEGVLPRGPASAWVVIDRDDPLSPSELGEVVLEGPWA